MKPELTVREATPRDAGSIVGLIRQMAAGSGEETALTEEYVLRYLQGARGGILLAGAEGQIRGLLSYSVRPDLYHAGNCVLIEELVVTEQYRRRGIGAALLAALLDRLPGLDCRELCLAVMPENEAAIRFYRRHGLTEQALFLERHFASGA